MLTFAPTPTLDPALAEALKVEGIERALSVPNPHRARVEAYVHRLCETEDEFTSDDVYILAEQDGDPLPDGLPMGAWFSSFAKRDYIERVWCPSRPSQRANSHKRTVTVWTRCTHD